MRLAPKNDRRKTAGIAGSAVALALCGAIVFGWNADIVAQQTPPATREERWQQDLNFFAREFPNDHMDFAKIFTKEQFAAEIASIEQAAPQSSDAQIILRLMRLVASGHIGHTHVLFPPQPMAFHRLPLTLYWYSDGLGVNAAAPEYKDALGSRVVRIGAMTPEQLESAVSQYIAYENETWLHELSPSYMIVEELLDELKITNADGRVEITFAKADGKQFALSIAPEDWSVKGATLNASEALNLPVALYRKHPDSFYWYEYLPDSQTLYIQYNKCMEDPSRAFADFSKEVFAIADAHPIRRTIVDLRFNQGGNSNIIKPLESGLKARKALSGQGHLFALIGPSTFSSGLLAATDFDNDLHAVLIGEPSGEKPNSYGEIRILTLPNSQIRTTYCTKFFRLMKNGDPPALEPKILVKPSLSDFLAGRDPVMDAAIHYLR
jgi:hypothetical protein